MAAQFRATKLPFLLLSSWIASAPNFFPEPVGPFIITGEAEDAIKLIIFFNSTAGFDCPIIFDLMTSFSLCLFGPKFALGYSGNYAISSLNRRNY